MATKSNKSTDTWDGRTAPDFTLQDQTGRAHQLKKLRGRWVVIFAYPKDMTSGCTKEACGFQARLGQFKKRGAEVFGLSILDTGSKAKFAAKHGLEYPLLADPDHAVCEALGVWKEKSLYGRKFFGISRETFVIDPAGKVARHFPKAKGNEEHADEVLQFLDAQVVPGR